MPPEPQDTPNQATEPFQRECWCGSWQGAPKHEHGTGRYCGEAQSIVVARLASAVGLPGAGPDEIEAAITKLRSEAWVRRVGPAWLHESNDMCVGAERELTELRAENVRLRAELDEAQNSYRLLREDHEQLKEVLGVARTEYGGKPISELDEYDRVRLTANGLQAMNGVQKLTIERLRAEAHSRAAENADLRESAARWKTELNRLRAELDETKKDLAVSKDVADVYKRGYERAYKRLAEVKDTGTDDRDAINNEPADCGHTNVSFDRSICPDPCNVMHNYCGDCGQCLDPCVHAASPVPPAPDEAREALRQLVALRVGSHVTPQRWAIAWDRAKAAVLAEAASETEPRPPVPDQDGERRCDMYVRTSAQSGDQPPTTKHIGDDVYVDRNEYGDVVGVEVLDATQVAINGVIVDPFPGKFRDTAPAGPRVAPEPREENLEIVVQAVVEHWVNHMGRSYPSEETSNRLGYLLDCLEDQFNRLAGRPEQDGEPA